MSLKSFENVAGPAQAEAYLFVEVAQGADPMVVLGALSSQHIVEWDAVRNARYGIVVHLHAVDEGGLEEQVRQLLSSVDGVGDHVFVPVQQPELSEVALERIQAYEEQLHDLPAGRVDEKASAYLLVDVEESRLGRVYSGLYATEEVVVLEADTRSNRLVALVQSEDFAALRRVVSDRIRVLDGVVGMVEMKVIPRDLM